MKTDSVGNVLWKHGGRDSIRFGGEDVFELNDGSFLVSGTMFDPSRAYGGTLARFSSDGELLFQKSYGDSSMVEFKKIIPWLDGTFLISGTKRTWSDYGVRYKSWRTWWIINVNEDGDILDEFDGGPLIMDVSEMSLIEKGYAVIMGYGTERFKTEIPWWKMIFNLPDWKKKEKQRTPEDLIVVHYRADKTVAENTEKTR
jgi:hypothetical protein